MTIIQTNDEWGGPARVAGWRIVVPSREGDYPASVDLLPDFDFESHSDRWMFCLKDQGVIFRREAEAKLVLDHVAEYLSHFASRPPAWIERLG